MRHTATDSHVRYSVVAFMVALAGVTYLDRVCISTLAGSIMRDLELSQVQMSYVFSAFTLAYAAFEVPTAWWADRIGSRRVLTRIVLWWSGCTMLTSLATGFGNLVATRFLFGVGEAGAWPNAARVFSRWIPQGERGRVQGIFFAGAHMAGGLTPALVALMATVMPWRAVFVSLGLVGVFWALAFYRWFRDEPREHSQTSETERDYIESNRLVADDHGSGGLGYALKTWSLLPLCIQYFANTYGFYFLITWLPTYLEKVRGFANAELAFYAGLPLLLSVVADLSGGWTTDWASKRFGRRFGRCSVGFLGYAMAAIATLIGARAADARLAAVLIAIAAAASMFTLAPAWATCIDLGGRYSGVFSAVMNTAGQVGGILSPIILAQIVKNFADWTISFYLMAGFHLLAALAWLVIQPVRKDQAAVLEPASAQ